MLFAVLLLMESPSSIRRCPLLHALPELLATRRILIGPLILRMVSQRDLSFGFTTARSGPVNRKVEILHDGRELCMSQQWRDGSDADHLGAAVKQHDRFPGTQVPGHVDDAVGMERMIVKCLGPLASCRILVRARYAIVSACRREALIKQFYQAQGTCGRPVLEGDNPARVKFRIVED